MFPVLDVAIDTPYAIDIGALVVAFIVGIAIPWLTEFITHATAPMWVRSVLNFGLSALAGILVTLTLADFNSLSDYLFTIATTWLATMRAHYAGMANIVAVKTAEFGIGSTAPKEPLV
jgi:fructose-specific phosphotransferase system IIC component